jgi:hypothetical protein
MLSCLSSRARYNRSHSFNEEANVPKEFKTPAVAADGGRGYLGRVGHPNVALVRRIKCVL